MNGLKEAVLEIVEIAKACPENLQTICFELLLSNHLTTLGKSGGGRRNMADDAKGDSKDESPDANPAPPRIEEAVKGQDDILETDIHVKARHFMKKGGVTIEQINNLFYKENGAIQPLYEDLKTTRMAESQVRIALLQALKRAIATGEFEAVTEEVRAEANARKCYDQNNFAKNFTNNATLFDFEKYEKSTTSIKLSEEGKKELVEVVKELQ